MKVPSRRKAREVALRSLYGMELNDLPASEAIEYGLEEVELSETLAEFARALTYGVRGNLETLDPAISAALSHYRIERLATLDRCLMRIAAYELLFLPGIPPAVTINEAVSLAKKYSTAESGKFVNGVLSAVLEASPKKNWDPATAPPEFEDEEPMEEIEAEAPPEEEVIQPDTEEAEAFKKVGPWTIKVEEKCEPKS